MTIGLRGKFADINAYTNKEERSQISYLSSHLRELKKKTKAKARRRKKIIKFKVDK